MLRINKTVSIPLNEIELIQIHASGPGGQNVNKVANGIHLRFAIKPSSLPEECKKKLLVCGDRRISNDGTIVIKAQRFRSTDKNREDALQRLRMLIAATLQRRRKRIPTAPSLTARKKRLEGKLRRGSDKALRRKIRHED